MLLRWSGVFGAWAAGVPVVARKGRLLATASRLRATDS